MKKMLILFVTIMSLCVFCEVRADDATEIAMLDELRFIDGFNAAMDGNIADQLLALTGSSGFGSLLNSEDDLKKREWSPNDWQSALKGLAGNNEQRYQELLQAYQEVHPTLSTTEANNGMSKSYATDYQQQVETNQAASTQASYAFNDTSEHLRNIKSISDKIEEATNSKQIQDLNARLNTEIAYLQVEVIKGLAVVNEQLAQQQATEIQDKTAAAKFNTIPS